MGHEERSEQRSQAGWINREGDRLICSRALRALLLSAALALSACAPAVVDPPAAPVDGGAHDDGGPEDSGVSLDAGPGSGAECTYNADCPALERCECSLEEGCACRTGPRGEGQSGVDRCDDGEDCATSLCVEGNDDFYCSGPCDTPADCGPALPLCSDIAFLGRVCVRDPA